jgi:hypothetical protein
MFPGLSLAPPLLPTSLPESESSQSLASQRRGLLLLLVPRQTPQGLCTTHYQQNTRDESRLCMHVSDRQPGTGIPPRQRPQDPVGLACLAAGVPGKRGESQNTRTTTTTHTPRHSSHLPDVIWARKERENEIGNGGGGGKGSLAPGPEPTGKWSRTISRARRSDGDSRIRLRFARPDEARQKPCLGVPALHTAQWEMVRYGSRSLLVGLMNCWGWRRGGLGGEGPAAGLRDKARLGVSDAPRQRGPCRGFDTRVGGQPR